MKKIIHTLSTGDPVWHDSDKRTITIDFQGPRKVLSTSLLNGGYSEGLKQVFNHNSTDENGGCMVMKGNTYGEHMSITAEELGYDIEAVTGMGTAARMENVALRVERFAQLTVTAIVTAGVEGNGGRVGDPTEHYLTVDKALLHRPGTINIMLVIDADIPPGILARALVTCTEAKTAALQELMAGSLYSTGLATGSGTDQTLIIANPGSALYFESAGKHSKLGELIGKAVVPALKEALEKQSGLCPDMQRSVFRRMKRYGVTMEGLLDPTAYKGSSTVPLSREVLEAVDRNPFLVTWVSLYVHLLDQVQWGLISGEEALGAAVEILDVQARVLGVERASAASDAIGDLLSAQREQLVILALVMEHERNAAV